MHVVLYRVLLGMCVCVCVCVCVCARARAVKTGSVQLKGISCFFPPEFLSHSLSEPLLHDTLCYSRSYTYLTRWYF